MIVDVLSVMPLWVKLPSVLLLCVLGLIVAAALFRASLMLAEMAWHGSLRATNALTYAFARAGLLAFEWCGIAIIGAAQGFCALIHWTWDQTAARLHGAIAVRIEAHRQRARLRQTWQNEFKDEFATFDDFLYAFEHGGKRRDDRKEPGFDSSRQGADPQGRADQRKPPPSDPRKVAYAAACRLLGLPEGGFSPEQLNARYRVLMSTSHPDRGGSNQRAAAINAARALIKRTRGWP